MRRRELVAGSIVASLLLFGVLFLGPPNEPPRRVDTPPPPAVIDREAERPARQKPADPRRPTEPKPPSPEGPRPGVDAGATATRPAPEAVFLTVRVVDSAGRAVPGIPVDVFETDPTTGPSKRLGLGVVSGAQGEARWAWPADQTVREGFVLSGVLTAVPHAVPVRREVVEPTVLVLPDFGDVEVGFVDEEGAPYLGAVDVRLLLAENDPPADLALRERSAARTTGGVARFEHVEAGTLLVVEGSTAEEGLRIAPLVAEGPSAVGSKIALTLRAMSRDAAPAGVSVFGPELGPPPVKPALPTEEEGSLILRPDPRDAVPAWPLVLEIVCGPKQGGGAGSSARVDEKSAARLNLPGGRFTARYRLWRATASGWLVVDVGGKKPADLTVRPGEERDLSIAVDRTALETAAGLLWGY